MHIQRTSFAGAIQESPGQPDQPWLHEGTAFFRLVANSTPSPWSRAADRLLREADRFLPPGCRPDAEAGRRARLISCFGFLGACFGLLYAGFYALIGHVWGAGIILICSLGFAATPRLLQQSGSLSLAANVLTTILTLGFTALSFVEGGLNGHAIAWLASVPLCALLLLGSRSAGAWLVVCVMAGLAVALAQWLGPALKPTYDASWHLAIAATGYLGLILFLFLLGAIFEAARARAFAKLRAALDNIEASNLELIRLNEEKNEFLGIAAHDLKNPLTVVIGTAELLRHGKPGQAEQLAGNIVAAGQRMLRLVKTLLDANAIEAGHFNARIERCELLALTRESLDHNQTAAQRKSIELRLESAVAVWARADRGSSLQILDNLISNAVKYSPNHTKVRVRLGMDEGMAFVAITDEGPGLSPEDQQKLFRKFTRLSALPTGGECATGLGLAIVKRLAEAMSGSVECHSVLGQGATFTMRLPEWTTPSDSDR